MTVTFPKLFKFRPECLGDIIRLGDFLDNRRPEPGLNDAVRAEIIAINPEISKSDHITSGGIFAFKAKSPEHLASLLDGMLHLDDGHRMWQTIDTAEEFTGNFVTDEAARGARILDALGDADPKTSTLYAELMEVPEVRQGSLTP